MQTVSGRRRPTLPRGQRRGDLLAVGLGPPRAQRVDGVQFVGVGSAPAGAGHAVDDEVVAEATVHIVRRHDDPGGLEGKVRFDPPRS